MIVNVTEPRVRITLDLNLTQVEALRLICGDRAEIKSRHNNRLWSIQDAISDILCGIERMLPKP